MTVTEASNNIYRFFIKNDFASVDEVKKENFTVESANDVDITYEIAFKKLVEMGVCEPLTHNPILFRPTKWVLVKPIDAWPQNIEIDGVLAVSIADVLNSLAKHFDGVEKIESSRISQKEIENLTMAAYELLKRLGEE